MNKLDLQVSRGGSCLKVSKPTCIWHLENAAPTDQSTIVKSERHGLALTNLVRGVSQLCARVHLPVRGSTPSAASLRLSFLTRNICIRSIWGACEKQSFIGPSKKI